MNRRQVTIFATLVVTTVIAILCSDHQYLLTAPISGRIGPGYAIVTTNAAWTPEREEIIRGKEDARRFLELNLQAPYTSEYTRNDIRKILSQWPRYRLQVFGKLENGRKVIHLNFLIIDDQFWMQNELVHVADGGTSFWRIDYDVEAKTFTRLEINGSA